MAEAGDYRIFAGWRSDPFFFDTEGALNNLLVLRNLSSSQAIAKLIFLPAEPKDDAQFIPVFAHSLEHTGGHSTDEATRVARTLLPDILFYDPSQPAVFPHNGRALTDDAIDVFLGVLTKGKITSDNVGPHKDLLSEFPFLGAPHEDRSAQRVAA